MRDLDGGTILKAMRVPALVLAAALLAFIPAFAAGQPATVTLTPGVVLAGAPELIRVHAPGAQAVDGEWLGRKIAFFRKGDDWFALAGVDVETPVGPSTVRITVHNAKGGSEDLSREVAIGEAQYQTGTLSVAPKFVEPPPEEAARIKAESELKAKVFAASVGERLWAGSFRVPVKAEATDSFGTRRMFNGKLASVHKGADFRAAMGTPVHAANSGTVVIARPLYFEGNCVVIDHGLGLFTLYMHFSRIEVKEGQTVRTGEMLGLSGATGRVTGPHLHWAVRWQGAYLDPIKLLRMDLSRIP
jgi:murein DD-endopeptidase MepM/ murein hydrolase activator NlpD